ncbi:MAG: HD domain-containing phosphohydrolase [Vampirovibrionales bacterium]|nr:HD domain-containing phosphohydrolase [Vampirovibrionales bacterium]
MSHEPSFNPHSVVSSSGGDHLNDPLEAIYALNIGDFVAESFISEDLLNKISQRIADDPAKLRAQLEELVQIYSVEKTLGILGFENTQNFVLYDSVSQTLERMFQVDACHLFQVANKESGDAYLSLSGTSCDMKGENRWELGVQTRANHWLSDVLRGFEPVIVNDVQKLPNWKAISPLGQEKTVSLLAAPLTEGGKATGVLVFERHSKQAGTVQFSGELEDLATVTARMFTTGMRLQQLIAQAQNEVQAETANPKTMQNLRAQITESIADLGIHQQSFMETLAHAVDARHDFTEGRSKSVAHIAKTIAESLDLNEKTIDLIYYAGLLGSIGKVDLPGSLIKKTGPLSADEWETLRNHPNVGVSLLGKMNFLSETSPYVQSQQERWDGSGNPEGLKGRSIPLGARVLSVADAYFAMTHPRPYKSEKPMTHAEALSMIQSESGHKWDPAIVEVFSKIHPDNLSA